ncbi:hypothetical protein MMC07_008750 [Pseudocyphellaria aurata]|nr:hypothetical protein [Pseudocyphellaria aurata]
MERWANAIRVGNATKENPPLALYQLWVSQGAVDTQYKAPLAKQERKEKKDYMAQGMATLIEMNERAFQMKMAQSLQKMTAGLGDVEQPSPIYAAPPSPPPQYFQPPRVEYAPKAAIPHPIQRPSSVAQPIETVRCSSPLTGREEEKEAMKQFFQWRLQQTSQEMVKTKINEAYNVSLREMWSLDNLKEMEDTSSERYKLTISRGIPDGLARGFCKDL